MTIRKKIFFAVVAAVIVAAMFTVDVRGLWRETLGMIERLGPWGPVIFVLIYVVSAVLLVPSSALTLSAGALFGMGLGSVLVSVGATLGATAAFLVGRYFARDWVAKKIEGNTAFAVIDRAVVAEGWKMVGLTRLSPAFPFTLLNYAFGLTRVSLRDYVLASWIGMMPGTVVYVYVGSLVRASGERDRTTVEWVFSGVGLIATIGVTVFVTRLACAALAKRTTFLPAAVR